jgi:hypothetical protein
MVGQTKMEQMMEPLLAKMDAIEQKMMANGCHAGHNGLPARRDDGLPWRDEGLVRNDGIL